MYVLKRQKDEFKFTFDEYRYPYHSYLSEIVENLTLKYIHKVIRKNEKNKFVLRKACPIPPTFHYMAHPIMNVVIVFEWTLLVRLCTNRLAVNTAHFGYL